MNLIVSLNKCMNETGYNYFFSEDSSGKVTSTIRQGANSFL